jgi:hypothetical protein
MSKICKLCNVEIEEDTKFCPQCGQRHENNEDSMLSNSKGLVPTIEVLRESSFVGCLLSYTIFVDGTEIGKIKNGEKKQFQLKPGLHEIYIKQNWSWCYSPKVSFLLKDFIKFNCRSKIGVFGVIFGKIVFYMFFKRHKFIALKEA